MLGCCADLNVELNAISSARDSAGGPRGVRFLPFTEGVVGALFPRFPCHRGTVDGDGRSWPASGKFSLAHAHTSSCKRTRSNARVGTLTQRNLYGRQSWGKTELASLQLTTPPTGVGPPAVISHKLHISHPPHLNLALSCLEVQAQHNRRSIVRA